MSAEPWFKDTFASVPPVKALKVAGSLALPVPTRFAAGITARIFWMAALVAPARSFWLGTLEDATVKLWCWRRPSYAKKKKTLFFLIGPPPLAPKSLRLKGACGFGAPVDVSRVLKTFRASSALLRKNSNNSAWYSFVPERVARLTMAPAFRPY